MILTRRKLLQGSAALGAATLSPHMGLAQNEGFTSITARLASMQLAPDGYAQTDVWGYEGLTPGPTIQVAKGARVQRQFVNELPQASSIHWHGIRIDNTMDGVSGLTQDAVEPGQTFDYDFVAPDAGTYWFHAHNQSVEQVARGLYGALIVEEDEAPDIDQEEIHIPPLFIQPLIENAIKHGFEGKQLDIDITILKETIEVSNNGKIEELVRYGTGLKNLDKRLELLEVGNLDYDTDEKMKFIIRIKSESINS